MGSFDFESLNRNLLSQIRTLVYEWLPGGKIVGPNYRCGSISGGEGQSFSVRLSDGVWKDYADPDLGGGDLISLYAAIHGINNGEAYKRLTGEDMQPVKRKHVDPLPRPEPDTPKYTIIKPTADALVPEFTNAESVYHYRDLDGSTINYIVRRQTAKGKTFTPYSYTTDGVWIKKHWPSPRPLYGLDLLAKAPESTPILLVEGEKAVHAARIFIKSYVVMSWQGGSSAVKQTDFTPIYGRRVLLWPDNDEPGIKAMNQVAQILNLNCLEVKILDTSGMPDKWDAADSEFKSYKDFTDWAKPRAELYVPVVIPDVMPDVEPEPIPMPGDDDLLGARAQFIATLADMAGGVERPTSPRLQKLYAEYGVSTTVAGIPIPNTSNVLAILKNFKDISDRIWFDEFHNKIYTTWNPWGSESNKAREWSDADIIALTVLIQSDFGLTRISESAVYSAVIHFAKTNIRNEPKEWMNSLKWDGVSRLERLFTDYFGAEDTPLTRVLSKKWFISLVARVFEPGCKVDSMVILEGRQGLGKSTALKIIGGDWYTESNEPVTSKDFCMVLQGNIIVEIAELDSFSRADALTIKKVITTATDRYRPPYGKIPANFPRTCVLIGTTNEDNYLRDTTGNRRFWPIETGFIDLIKLRDDRSQLYAEAVHMYKQGEDWWDLSKHQEEITKEQAHRLDVDPWVVFFEEYFDNERRFGRDRFHNKDLPNHLLKIFTDLTESDINKFTISRARQCLKFIGYKYTAIRLDAVNAPVKGWIFKGNDNSVTLDRVTTNAKLPDSIAEMPPKNVVKNHAPNAVL